MKKHRKLKLFRTVKEECGMKRTIMILIALALCLCIGTSLADTYYVKSDAPLNLRDENTNEVLTTIPVGTALEPIGEKCTDLCAYVTYNGFSGLVLWNYLTRTPPGKDAAPKAGKTSTPTPAPKAEQPRPTAAPNPGVMTLKAVNAVLQRANSRNKAEGAEKEEMTVRETDNILITSRVKTVEYWVINGVRYDFLKNVASFRLTAFDQSWTFEAVGKGNEPSTLLSDKEIQAARTGRALLCRVKHAELCHIKDIRNNRGAGGWIHEFDFTDDYTNRATGAKEKGGQLSGRVKASVPKGKKVLGWKFDETELYPQRATVSAFVFSGLNVSILYEPIYTKTASATKPPVTNPPEKKTKYVTVTCIKCHITGGQYSGKTSAKVPVGTKISVIANENSSEVYWEINGSNIGKKGRTITRTINSNTTIEAFPVIN